jgi:DNA-binding NarL/FixJ family response regulator
MELSNEAKKARNAYIRAWRLKNADKMRMYNATYWNKKADPIAAEVRKLSKSGMSQRDISKRLLISLGTVNNYLNAKLNTI